MTGIETALAANAVKAASGPASSFLMKFGKSKYDKFVATYTNAFSEHLSSSVRKCASVKNIIYRNQLAKTDEKYVNVTFSENDANILDHDLVDRLKTGENFIIRGRGGAGKTMFTKWAVLRLAESLENHQLIPLYIELRDLETLDRNQHFHETIFRLTSASASKATLNQFTEGLKSGMFVIILDAADEINKEIRTDVIKSIKYFSENFESCGILLTSRDFSEIDGLTGFTSMNSNPLERTQAIEIIEKLDYDNEVKSALIADIKEDKYEKHEFFLENPLLVTIMLLTFDQSKHIPNKKSAFYKRAFEALYERHDAAKGIYRRQHHAQLPMDEFEKIFSIFSFGTYVHSLVDFSDTDTERYFRESCSQAGIAVDASLVLKDASESTCLLVREGYDYTFVHRSFQEYFSAIYLRDYREKNAAKIFDFVLSRGGGDNVFEFIYEMDQFSLEKNYILPKLKKIEKNLSRYDHSTTEGQIKIVATLFSYIDINVDTMAFSGALFKINDMNLLMNIRKVYGRIDPFKVVSDRKNHIFNLELSKDKILKSNAAKRKPNRDRIGDFFRITFTPASADFLEGSLMLEKAKDFSQDVSNFVRELEKKHNAPKDEVIAKFAAFSRT